MNRPFIASLVASAALLSLSGCGGGSAATTRGFPSPTPTPTPTVSPTPQNGVLTNRILRNGDSFAYDAYFASTGILGAFNGTYTVSYSSINTVPGATLAETDTLTNSDGTTNASYIRYINQDSSGGIHVVGTKIGFPYNESAFSLPVSLSWVPGSYPFVGSVGTATPYYSSFVSIKRGPELDAVTAGTFTVYDLNVSYNDNSIQYSGAINYSPEIGAIVDASLTGNLTYRTITRQISLTLRSYHLAN